MNDNSQLHNTSRSMGLGSTGKTQLPIIQLQDRN